MGITIAELTRAAESALRVLLLGIGAAMPSPVQRQLPTAPSDGATRAAFGALLPAHPSILDTQVCCGFFPPALWFPEQALECRGAFGQ